MPMRKVLFFFFLIVATGQAGPRLKPGDRIVTLGDSITQAGGYQRVIEQVLSRFYPELKVEIVNAGISGHKAPDMMARLDRDVLSKRPNLVTISCGVNDVWHGFTKNPPDGVDLETYSSLIREMVKKIRASTQAEVYLLTPTVIKEDLLSPENRKLEPYCEAIREIARTEHTVLVDTNQIFNLVLKATQAGGSGGFHPTTDGVHMKPSGNFLMGAAILRALEVPMTQILAALETVTPAISAADPQLQYWGRWDMREASGKGAITVNTGSTLLLRFRGNSLTLHFGISHYTEQLPTLWMQLDELDWKVVRPAEQLEVKGMENAASDHTLRLVVKGFREWENRWETPLVNAIEFKGITLGAGTVLLDPPPRPAKLVEYLGDSITEGVLVLNSGPREKWTRERWPEYSEGRRNWAYQSALLAGAEPRTVGFGRMGLTIHANGGVPPGIHSFPWVYNGVPIDKSRLPDAVVINLGTNDWNPAVREAFLPLYQAYVQLIRKTYPESWIFCLRPFNGAHADTIRKVAESAGDAKMKYVDTTGWIEPEKHTTDGVHLNLEGNKVAAEKMAAILKPCL
jgi:lysophospholipase L1-like esterase